MPRLQVSRNRFSVLNRAVAVRFVLHPVLIAELGVATPLAGGILVTPTSRHVQSMSALRGKADIDSCAQKRLKLRNGRASILFIFSPFFRDIPHLMKHIERKERHPLLLVGAQSLIQRLPRTGEFLEVG